MSERRLRPFTVMTTSSGTSGTQSFGVAPGSVNGVTPVPAAGASLVSVGVRVSTASTGGTPPHTYTVRPRVSVSDFVLGVFFTFVGSTLGATGFGTGNGAVISAADAYDVYDFEVSAVTGAPAAAASGRCVFIWSL